MNKSYFKINLHRIVITLTVFSAFAFLACDRGDSSDSESEDGLIPCGLTTPAVIQSCFGGTVSDGAPGAAAYGCEYQVNNSSATYLKKVVIYHFSNNAAADWDRIRKQYEADRGGITEIPGIGDAAFNPNDIARNEIVVRKGSKIFSVGPITQPFQGMPLSTANLAGKVADSL